MKFRTTAALLLCAAASWALSGAAPAIAQMGGGMAPTSTPPPSRASSSQPHVSKSVGPQLVDAQKSIQAKNFPDAMTKLKAAQATPDLQPYDVFIINALIAQAAQGLNDSTTASTAVEAAADSGGAPDDDKKNIVHDAVQASAFLKHWQKTIAYGQQLATMNGLDYQTAANIAIAYYNLNDFAHAQQFAQQSITLSKAAGQQPDQNVLAITMSSEAKQNNQTGAEQTLEQMAITNNSPDAWAQLVGVAFGAKGMNDATALYLYRLLVVAGAMKPSDYKEIGSLLGELGYPTEAANVLQQGVASGKISSAQVGAMLSKARRDAASDERALPQIAQSAAKSRTGEQDVKLGEDYWGYGRYADAEAAARRAIAKGGLKTPSEGPLLVGAAEVAQGKYADAIQSLSQVAGSEAVTRAARLWSLYAQAKQGPQRTTTAPGSQTPSR